MRLFSGVAKSLDSVVSAAAEEIKGSASEIRSALTEWQTDHPWVDIGMRALLAETVVRTSGVSSWMRGSFDIQATRILIAPLWGFLTGLRGLARHYLNEIDIDYDRIFQKPEEYQSAGKKTLWQRLAEFRQNHPAVLSVAAAESLLFFTGNHSMLSSPIYLELQRVSPQNLPNYVIGTEIKILSAMFLVKPALEALFTDMFGRRSITGGVGKAVEYLLQNITGPFEGNKKRDLLPEECFAIGHIYFKKGMFEDGFEFLNKLLRQTAGGVPIFRNKSVMLDFKLASYARQFRRCRQSFLEGRMSFEKYLPNLFLFVPIYAAQEKRETALQYIDECRERALQQTNPAVLAMLGHALDVLGFRERADTYFGETINMVAGHECLTADDLRERFVDIGIPSKHPVKDLRIAGMRPETSSLAVKLLPTPEKAEEDFAVFNTIAAAEGYAGETRALSTLGGRGLLIKKTIHPNPADYISAHPDKAEFVLDTVASEIIRLDRIFRERIDGMTVNGQRIAMRRSPYREDSHYLQKKIDSTLLQPAESSTGIIVPENVSRAIIENCWPLQELANILPESYDFARLGRQVLNSGFWDRDNPFDFEEREFGPLFLEPETFDASLNFWVAQKQRGRSIKPFFVKHFNQSREIDLYEDFKQGDSAERCELGTGIGRRTKLAGYFVFRDGARNSKVTPEMIEFAFSLPIRQFEEMKGRGLLMRSESAALSAMFGGYAELARHKDKIIEAARQRTGE